MKTLAASILPIGIIRLTPHAQAFLQLHEVGIYMRVMVSHG